MPERLSFFLARRRTGSEREKIILFFPIEENSDTFSSQRNSAHHSIAWFILYFVDDDCPQPEILHGEFLLRTIPMTEVYTRMPSEDDEDSPAKCRERRRRRIEMRRLATVSSGNPSPSTTPHHRKENQTGTSGFEKKRGRKTDGDGNPEISSSSSSGEEVKTVRASPSVPQPVFGMMSVSGRSREMEDAVSVSTCVLGSENFRRQLVHFFAVYDGHGGPHVKH